MREETLFISDLHLSAERPETVERFLKLCKNRILGARRLYILGDLFDAYLGDDNHDYPFGPVKKVLKRLTRAGTEVYFLPGNRDFLVGEGFSKETGVLLLGDYEVIELGPSLALLTHGDLLCTDDIQYQAARIKVRSAEWRAYALGKPLWLRKLYARWYRYKSGLDKRGKTLEIMDVNEAAVLEAFRTFKVTRLIHGHTHRAQLHQLVVDDVAVERHVLPEWDGHEWLVVFDHNGHRQEPIDMQASTAQST